MATNTIGAAGDYATIAAWATAVKAIGTLTENEIGQCIDDANYARGAASDLDFSGVTLSGFTITLEATTNKHDGDFGTGSRVEVSSAFGGVYQPKDCTILDMSMVNTQPTSGGSRVLNSAVSVILKRFIAKTDSSGANSDVIKTSSGGLCTLEVVRTDGGTIGISLQHASDTINACTVIGAATGILAGTANTGTSKNNAVYNCTTDWSGTFSGTYTNNASEDATHPGTAGVTISGDPFDGDGYTPASSGQLDGTGTDLSISLDAAQNSFNATPSIGAYESIAVAGGTGKSNPLLGPLGGPLAGVIA